MAGEWRFFGRLTAFGALTLALLGGTEVAVDAAFQDHCDRKTRAIFAAEQPFKQVILGTSRSAHGIDPAALEPDFSFYNFAYNGSGPGYHERWYRTFRQAQAAPELVVIGVDRYVFSHMLDRRFEQDAQHLSLPVLAGLVADPTVSVSLLLSNRFALLRHRQALQERLGKPSAYWVDMPHYYKGYVPLRADRQYLEPSRHEGIDQPEQRAAFERLLTALRSDGARVVFVHPPEYFPAVGEHPGDPVLADLDRLAREAGIPFLDYNRALKSEINREARYFVDGAHMSEEGAEVFSRRLAADLGRALARP